MAEQKMGDGIKAPIGTGCGTCAEVIEEHDDGVFVIVRIIMLATATGAGSRSG